MSFFFPGQVQLGLLHRSAETHGWPTFTSAPRAGAGRLFQSECHGLCEPRSLCDVDGRGPTTVIVFFFLMEF